MKDVDALTEEDRAEIAAQLVQEAEAAQIAEPPQVDIVRLVSQADWPQTRIACMKEAGFEVTLAAGGTGVSIEYAPDQIEATDLAYYTCAAQYPIDPGQTGELSDRQKEIVYEYVSQTLVPCLETEGYKTTGLPTKSTFLAGFEGSPPWNPFNQIYTTVTSTKELDRLEAACPPNTPPNLLYSE